MADPAINGTNADADIETGGAEPSPRQKRFFPDWPGIGSHLRYCWIDIAIFLLLVAAALALFLKPPDLARQIKFAVDSTTGSALWPDIAYPKQKEIVNTVVSAVIATTVPIVVIVGISVGFIRSYRSLEAATRGLNMTLLSTTLVTLMIKTMIGGLRPHFLDVCKPKYNAPGFPGPQYGHHIVFYGDEVCTGDRDDIREAQMSLPSGHSSSAFAGGVYLTLWLNAVLKIVGPYQTPWWKLIILVAPLVGATLLGLSKVLDRSHHWSDVVVGGIIGALFAFLGFRSVHAAIWDSRYNHIPLSHLEPLDYDATISINHRVVASRKALWAPKEEHDTAAEQVRDEQPGIGN